MILAVEHDVVPAYGTDVGNEFGINGGDFFGRSFEELGHFPGLPVDDGRRNEGETAARIKLLMDFLSTDTSPLGKEDVAGELMKLLDFQETLPDAFSERWLGKVVEKELGLDDSPEVLVSSMKVVLVVVSDEAFESHGGGGVSGFQRGIKPPHFIPIFCNELRVDG